MKDFLSQLRKDYGEDILERREGIRVIKTGSLSLDLSIGIGGIPKSKFTEIYGPESSGKTTLAFELCKNALEAGENVLFVDAENAIDFEYMKEIVGSNFDEENKTLMTNQETGATIVVVQPDTGENSLNIIEQGLIYGEFGLIILDSVGALAPQAEKEKELEDATVALTSRLLSKFFRRTAYFVRKNDVAVIFLNQVRDKIGSYMGGYESPGGHALKHYTSVRVKLGKGEHIKQDKQDVGMLVPFTVIKNKVSNPYRSSTFPLLYGKGIDRIRDVVGFCKFLGVIKLRGAHYVTVEGEHIGHGMNNVIETLAENKDTLDKLIEMCYNSVVGNVEVGEDTEELTLDK